MTFGERIVDLRTKAGLSQEALSEQLGISRQSVAKWESGDSLPDIDRLLTISQIFCVSVDYLLKGRNAYTDAAVSKTSDSDLQDIKAFLCLAKKNTYAAHAAEIPSSRLHSHDLCFEEKDFRYLDSYVGGERFSGQELLYVKDRPFWAMNYSGRVLDKNFSGDFLKESLSQVKAELPYRGPEIFSRGKFSYHCRIDGAFQWFHGNEEIFFEETRVYECLFQGGTVI